MPRVVFLPVTILALQIGPGSMRAAHDSWASRTRHWLSEFFAVAATRRFSGGALKMVANRARRRSRFGMDSCALTAGEIAAVRNLQKSNESAAMPSAMISKPGSTSTKPTKSDEAKTFTMDKSPHPEEAARKRKAMRRFISVWAIVGGIVFIVFGRNWLVNGLPVYWIGYVIGLLGILGLAGVNVFRGGPLDSRLDKATLSAPKPAPVQPTYTPPPSRTDRIKCQRLKDELATQPEPQIVSIERFFDGNDDLGSIGCNLPDH